MAKTLIATDRVVNEGQITELDVLINGQRVCHTGELDRFFCGKRLDFGQLH